MSLTHIESPVVTKMSPSPNYDSPSGRRFGLFVVHDVESPLAQEYADSLAGPNWFGGNPNCGTSAHYIVGPRYAIQMVSELDRAWHVGAVANLTTTGAEQTGYARFSRADWTTPDGLAQIKNMAALISDFSVRHGGPVNPQRATLAEIKAYVNGNQMPGGVKWCAHHDITLSVGGTTHTDPDPNFPFDLLQQALDALAAPPPPPPAPQPTEDDIMAQLSPETLQQLSDLIDARIKAALTDATVIPVKYVDTAATPNVQTGSVVDAIARDLRVDTANFAGVNVAPHPATAGS